MLEYPNFTGKRNPPPLSNDDIENARRHQNMNHQKYAQVDLAGSERVHKTQTGGQTLVEAKHINVSLFFLEMVIVALRERGTKGRRVYFLLRNIHSPVAL